MGVFLSPQVVTRDVDFSAYVTSASTCVAGVVGCATKGPLNVRTLCTSPSDFVRKFGVPPTGDHGALAAIKFLKKGNQLWYVRVAKDTAAAASAAFDGKAVDSVTTVSAILTLTAKEKGTYGNGLKAIISNVSGLKFTLSIYKDETLDEQFVTTLDTNDDTYIGNKTSNWVNFTINLGAATTVTAATKSLTAGSDGILTGTDTALIIGNEATASGLQQFANPDECDINLVYAPGWSAAAINSALITLADSRGDCLALLDPAQASDVTAVSTAFDTNNTSCAATYYPWVKIFNSYSGAEEWVPPSTVVAGVYAYNDSVGNVWNAPAGLNRGMLDDVLAVENALTPGSRDLLYQKNINMIINYKNMGFCVWGQKTLQKTASALDRVGVKRLVMYVKKVIATSTAFLMFENNNSTTWDLWCGMIRPFLDSIKNMGGLYDFKVVMDGTTVTSQNIDAGEMPGQVFLKPTKAAEFIPIDFILKSTGASFEG